MTYVLGVDPGGQSGFCLLKLHDAYPAKVMDLRIVEGRLAGFLEYWYAKVEFPEHVVVESFHDDGRTEDPDEIALEIIGAIKGWHFREARGRRVKLAFQLPVERGKEKHMTDAILKRAGYYPPRGQIGKKHQVEAMRHALTYCVKQLNHRPTQKLLYPPE
jgi:hypothetical protein